MNVVVDGLQGKGSSKDIFVISQLQILKSGSDQNTNSSMKPYQ